MPLDLDTTLTRAQFSADASGRVSALRQRDGAGDDPAALAEAAVQFETLLLKQLVAAMRETVLTDEDSKGDQLTEHLIEDALATHLARSGGVGLAELIVRDAQGPPSAPGPDPLGIGGADDLKATAGADGGAPHDAVAPVGTEASARTPEASRQLHASPPTREPAGTGRPFTDSSHEAPPAGRGDRVETPRPRPLEYTASPPDAADLLRRLLAPAPEPAVTGAPATSTKSVDGD